MRRIGLYARVSTTDQHPEVQLLALRGYAQARGLEVAGEYVDHGVSGARARRPALDRLVGDARRRHFDALAVVKLDRLARSVHHLVTLARDFGELGVDLVVLDQSIDTSTSTGRLLFHVLGSIAEFERDLIRERVAAGMAAARRRGARIGRPRALRGARGRVEALRAEGHSLRAIARALGVAPATVAAELARSAGRGAAPAHATSEAAALA
jgi:DNA invertase Pin-like site-specific DNA recombinase